MVKGCLVGILVTLVLVGCTSGMSISADTVTDQFTYSGHVYEIDFLNSLPQRWTQIAIKPSDGSAQPFQTDSPFVQAVLETALLGKFPTVVTFVPTGNNQPPKIKTAVVSAACLENDCVKRVSCASDGECTAQIYGKTQEPRTNNLRALGVLLTAMNKKKAVEYLELEDNYYIKRVKINVPLDN